LANLAALNETGNAYSIVVTDTISIASAALNALDAKTTGLVNATAVATMTGSGSDFDTLLAAKLANTISLANNFDVIVNVGNLTVLQANAIDAVNGTGTITATISDGSAADLITLIGTHAYTIAVSDTSVSAANLNTINAATSIAVNLDAVTAIGGSASDVATVYTANTNSTVSGLGDETVTLTAGAALITDLMTIYTDTAVTVGTAVNDISGTGADFDALFLAQAASEISLSGSFVAHLTGTNVNQNATTVNQLMSVDAATSGLFTTVDLTDTYDQISTLLSQSVAIKNAEIASVTGQITVNGTGANDVINMTPFGSLYNGLIINAGKGDDTITGTTLSDFIDGGPGNDYMTGGLGADTITGGSGINKFNYNSAGDSTITSTTGAASGFDLVSLQTGDIITFANLATSPTNMSVISQVFNTGTAMGASGNALLGQLNTVFTENDNNIVDYEASIIRFSGGQTFVAFDYDRNQTITSADTIIQLSGTISGISVNGDSDLVII
jgi:hypothetical protein